MSINCDQGLQRIAESKTHSGLFFRAVASIPVTANVTTAFAKGRELALEHGNQPLQMVTFGPTVFIFLGTVEDVQRQLDGLPNATDE